MIKFKIGDKIVATRDDIMNMFRTGDRGVITRIGWIGHAIAKWENGKTQTVFDNEADVVRNHRYPWESAPEWAMFAATDKSGVRYWYERTPRAILDKIFTPSGGRHRPIGEDVTDWKDSIETRPQEFKLKPETVRMTHAEICKALGKNIEIVKE